MQKPSLQSASISCLIGWAGIWMFFTLIRISSFDIRVIPGIGPVMLLALVAVFLAPVAATGIAGWALLRQPRAPLNWLLLACGIAAVIGQQMLFTSKGWL